MSKKFKCRISFLVILCILCTYFVISPNIVKATENDIYVAKDKFYDAYSNEWYGDYNGKLWSGKFNGGNAESTAYFGFGLSAIIPESAVITSAGLKLYLTSLTADCKVDIYGSINDKWGDENSNGDKPEEGQLLASQVLLTQKDNPEWITIPIANMTYLNQIASDNKYVTLILKQSDTGEDAYIEFSSSEGGNYAKLSVAYTEAATPTAPATFAVSHPTSGDNAVNDDGKSKVTVTWTDSATTTVDHYEIVAKVGSAPAVGDTVTGNIAKGKGTASFEWKAGDDLYVGVVAVDTNGLKTLCIGTPSNITVAADGHTPTAPLAFMVNQPITLDNGVNDDGKSKVTVTWTDSATTTVDHYEIVAKVGSAPTVSDTVTGNIAKGKETASFDWKSGDDLYVGVVAVDTNGLKTLCIGTPSNVRVAADGHTPTAPLAFMVNQPITLDNAVNDDGKSKVTVTWTDSATTTVDHYEIVAKVGSAPTVSDTVTGNIAKGKETASFDWKSGDDLYVGVVAVDTNGLKTLCIGTPSNVRVAADGHTPTAPLAFMVNQPITLDNGVNDDGKSKVTVTWTDSATTTVDHYEIVAKVGSAPTVNDTVTGNIANGKGTASFDWKAGDDLYVGVVAVDGNGLKTLCIGTPSNITVAADGHTSTAPLAFIVNQPITVDNGVNDDGKSKVTVTWTDSATVTVEHYEIVAKVGSAPTASDIVSGNTNIAKGKRTASFDWKAGDDLYVGVVAVDGNGLKTLCIGTPSNITVAADGHTPTAPLAFMVNQPITLDNGVNDDGKSKVTVTWTDSVTTTVDHYEIVAKVGSAPTVSDTVTGNINIAKGKGTASFDWKSGDDLYVGVVAVDTNGLKTLCIGTPANVTVAADRHTPKAPLAFIVNQPITLDNEVNDDGKSKVTVTWTDSATTTVDHYEIVAKVGSAPAVGDTVTGNIAKGKGTASFEWKAGDDLYVGVVAVDTNGLKTLCIGTPSNVTVAADGHTPKEPLAFMVNQPITVDNGVNDDGKSKVTVTWTDSVTTTVDHYEIVAKVGSAPTVSDTVTGNINIAKGKGTASFDWKYGDDLYVGVVVVDANGLKTLCIGTPSNVTVVADGHTPTAPNNSAISPNAGSFDKKASAQADVSTAMTLNGNTLGSIINGATTLVENTDYTVSGSTVTIKKEYLAKQGVGTTNLVFNFSAGNSQTLVITVSDTTPIAPNNSTINPSTGSFDKKTSAQADVSTAMTLNGNTLGSIINGATTLVENTDYTVSGSTVTIKKEYLAKQGVGTTNLVFNFSAGNSQTLVITVSDTTPIAPNNSTISPSTGSFDKKTSEQKDVSTAMNLNGNTLSNIKNGTTTLVENTDYTVSGNTVIIKKEYLAKQEVGKISLTFNFSAGNSQTLVITVSDTTPIAPNNSTISPNTGSFDKKTSEQKDVSTTINLNGNSLSSIKNGTTTLVESTDYTVSGNTVTIKKEYLAKQGVGTTTLTFNFSAGNSQTLAITVSDTTTVSYILTYAAGVNGSIAGSVLQTIVGGGSGSLVTAVPNKGYYFVKWSDGVTTATRVDKNVTSNISVTAIFAIKTYIVTFKDYDGKVLCTTQTIEHGKGATAPSNPTRTGYTFAGWDKVFNNVTEDLVVTATYTSKAPTDITLSNNSVQENAIIGTEVGRFTTTDAEEGIFKYELVSGFKDNASFQISEDKLKTAESFNYGTKNTYNIKVRVTDLSNLTYEKVFTINIIKTINVNNTPVVNNATIYGTEDIAYKFNLKDFVGNYVDKENDLLAKIQITELPSNIDLILNGNKVKLNEEISVENLEKLSLVPLKNWNGKTTFAWRAFDGKAYSQAATMEVNIASVNDAPVVKEINKLGKEDTILKFTKEEFTQAFSDVDDSEVLNKIKITSLPSNGVLKVNDIIIKLGEEIQTSEIDKLVFIPNENWNGTTTFTWKASDGKAYSESAATIVINVSKENDAPIICDGSKTGDKNKELLFEKEDFTRNFVDLDKDELTKIQIMSIPTHGVLKVNGNVIKVNDEISSENLSRISFMPETNWNGDVSFNWKGSDGNSYSLLAEMLIRIAPDNDAPVVMNKDTNGKENTPVTFEVEDFITNYSDKENDSMTKIKVVSLPLNGVLKFRNVPSKKQGLKGLMAINYKLADSNSGDLVAINDEIPVEQLKNLSFEPNSNWTGDTFFAWKGYDGKSYSKTAAVMDVNISKVNNCPILIDAAINGVEDTNLNLNEQIFTGNYIDAENDPITSIQIITLPLHGTLKLNGNAVNIKDIIKVNDFSKLSFIPDTDWNGVTSFKWKASDGIQYSDTIAEVSINISGVNDVPKVFDAIKHGSDFKTTDFTENYLDIDGDSLEKIKITSLALNGILKVNDKEIKINDEILAENFNNIKFEANVGWLGKTSFGWKGFDGKVYTVSSANMTIELDKTNNVPIVKDSINNGTEDTELLFVSKDFTDNFTDIDGEGLSKIKITTIPENGVLKLNDKLISLNEEIKAEDLGEIRFIPNNNWNKRTILTWKGHDGIAYSTSQATITINIAPVNDIPVVLDDTKNGAEDNTILFTVEDFKNNFSDIDGDELNKIQILSLPENGILKLEEKDIKIGKEIPVLSLAKIKFLPNANWYGSTSFDWKGNDGVVYSTDKAKFTIVISSVNDEPVVKNSTIEGKENTNVAFKVEDFTSNYSDLEGEKLSKVQIVTLPQNGVLKLNGVPVKLNQVISIESIKNLDFEPNRGWHGSASFNWKGNDGTNYSILSAKITMNIAEEIHVSPNQPSDNRGSIVNINPKNNEPIAENGNITVMKDTIANGKLIASDKDNDVLSYIIVANPSNGTVRIVNETTGEYIYTPNKDSKGTDTFTFKVSDGKAYSNIAAINVNIIEDVPKKSSNANLIDINISEGNLNPIFNKDISFYETKVDNKTEKVTVSVKTEASSKVKINGISGLNLVVGLSVGENIVNIEVTAEDGTQKIYKLRINRDKVSSVKKVPKVTFVGLEHSPICVGETESFYITSKADNKVQYRIFLCNDTKKTKEELTNGYTQLVAPDFPYIVTPDHKFTLGMYRLEIWVKEEGSNKEYDNTYTAHLNCVNRDNKNRVYTNGDLIVEKDTYTVGEKVVVSGIKDIGGLPGPYYYRLHILRPEQIGKEGENSNGWYYYVTDYKSAIEWTPQEAGTYIIDVHVITPNSILWKNKDRKSKLIYGTYEGWKLKTIVVKEKNNN